MKLEVTSTPAEKDKETIALGLSEQAAQAKYPWDEKELAVFYRDVKGEIVAGLTGVTFWRCLSVKHLWVASEVRRTGLGRVLLGAAELEAKQRGCKLSYLDTYTFQSPEFYTSLGYKVCGRIDNFPEGESRLFYVKTL